MCIHMPALFTIHTSRSVMDCIPLSTARVNSVQDGKVVSDSPSTADCLRSSARCIARRMTKLSPNYGMGKNSFQQESHWHTFVLIFDTIFAMYSRCCCVNGLVLMAFRKLVSFLNSTRYSLQGSVQRHESTSIYPLLQKSGQGSICMHKRRLARKLLSDNVYRRECTHKSFVRGSWTDTQKRTLPHNLLSEKTHKHTKANCLYWRISYTSNIEASRFSC